MPLKLTTTMLLLIGLQAPGNLQAHNPDPPGKARINGDKLTAVEWQVPLEADLERAWDILARKFVEVDKVIRGIQQSHRIPQYPAIGRGAARYCAVTLKNREITVKERIVHWENAPTHKNYMYEVYEFENFPLSKMYSIWGVKEENGQVVLYNKIYYKMTSGLLTRVLRQQMKKMAKIGVLQFKHYIETGEGNLRTKTLMDRYPHLAS